MIHYRNDGRPKRTLCGLRIALDGGSRSRPIRGPHGGVVGRREEPITDKQPRQLLRNVSWLPQTAPEDDVFSSRECPLCLAAGREQIEKAKSKTQTSGNTTPRWLADAQRVAEEREES